MNQGHARRTNMSSVKIESIFGQRLRCGSLRIDDHQSSIIPLVVSTVRSRLQTCACIASCLKDRQIPVGISAEFHVVSLDDAVELSNARWSGACPPPTLLWRTNDRHSRIDPFPSALPECRKVKEFLSFPLPGTPGRGNDTNCSTPKRIRRGQAPNG